MINAVFNNHNFTLVILDNRTTAMTGHQPNPGVDMEEMGFEGYGKINMQELVKSVGVPHVTTINPYNIKKSTEKVKEALVHFSSRGAMDVETLGEALIDL